MISAADANAVPVAEFAFAQIVFSLKRGWLHARRLRESEPDARKRVAVPGTFGSRVGILALGAIGRKVCAFLKMTEVEILAHDPFAPDAVFESCGARKATLDEIFSTCDVVSVHLPNLPSTRGVLDARLLSRLKPGATLINTARGDVLDEVALFETLRARPDVWAVLDVLADADRGVAPELPALENVVLTPHIAGSLDAECRRMGRFIADDLGRYLSGETPRGLVTRERLERMA
jgi:phosphoglycerate dehydrogenase-like enzyme